jgi:hypothetical protein
VRWHTERVDIVLLAELLKLKMVALMATKDEQPTYPSYLVLCMLESVLWLLYTKLIGSPAIVANSNSPVVRNM